MFNESAQNFVTHNVTVILVEFPEFIEINENHRNFHSLLKLLLPPFSESITPRESGHWVIRFSEFA